MIKDAFLVNDTLTNKISYYHIAVLMATLPFDLFYSHIVFVSFALHTLINLQKGDFKKLLNSQILILQVVFYAMLFGCVYTGYPSTAAADITRQLAIFLFPVFFSLTGLSVAKYRDQLLFLFSVVCLISIAYLYAHAFWVLLYFKLPVWLIFSNSFISHNFSAPIGIHATFFSLQVGIALFFMISQFIKCKSSKRILYLLAALLLFAGIIQLGSKAVLAAVLLGINVAVPYFLLIGKLRVRYVLVMSLFSILVIAATLNTGSFRERYFTDLKNDLSKTKPDEAVEPRLIRWQAALNLAKKSPAIGYGTGAELSILRDEYFKGKLYSAFLNRLNAHNQYITFLLITGIGGLLVYLGTLFYGFKMAVIKKDMLLFIFILLVTTVSVSESMLNAEKGIWFYAFFLSFFTLSNQPSAT